MPSSNLRTQTCALISWVQTPAEQVASDISWDGLLYTRGSFLWALWMDCLTGSSSISPAGRATKGRFLGVVTTVHPVYLPRMQGRTGKEAIRWDGLAISSFQLTLPDPEELWPNLCFKETTNKCKRSVSKASVQLLVSWSPLHCNVYLSILVTAEKVSQLQWPVQTVISIEGKVHVCTYFYS